MINNLELFHGKNITLFIGVVEDNADPLTLGRVKVRCFGYHPEDRTQVPTVDLPWANVLQPSTSASNSGVGWSPNGLQRGSWVMGLFLDGENAQHPWVLGSIPGIHRPSGAGDFIGNSGSGYLNDSSLYSGDSTDGPYMDNPINPGSGSVIKDDGSYLTKQNISNWPLKIYKPTPSRGDTGLACKDRNSSLRIHYASALALEKLTQEFGKSSLGITSAYRTPAYNAQVGGAKGSLHKEGRAFDITLSSIGNSRSEIARFAKTAVQNGFVGFGLYNSFIHIDTGRGRTWNGAKSKWFTEAIRSAGWYPGKAGLSDVKVNPVASSNNSSETTQSTIDAGDLNTRQEVADYVKQRSKEEGFTDVQTAAILANVERESSFNPNAVGDGGAAYGLFQWNDRRSSLYSYAAANGKDPSSPVTQMDFFIHELNTSESRAGSQLRNASSLQEATTAMANFERYQGYQGGAEYQNRLALANQYYGNELDTQNVSTAGFRDPTGSFPYGGYRGKPSTHHAARGLNGNMYQPELDKNQSGRIGGFPVAGDKGTIGEPDMGAAPQYPYNVVYASLSGHMMEFDSTPGSQRVNFQHSSGSRYEVSDKGTTLIKSMGRTYHLSTDNFYGMMLGGYELSVKDDIGVRSTSDITHHADGSYVVLVRNDSFEQISGKKDVVAGEVIQIKTKKLIIEADQIDFVSHGGINFEAAKDINVRAGGSFNMSAKSDVTTYAGGNFNADVGGELHWLEGEVEELPENTASSTDLGAPPSRAKVEKSPYMKNNPDAVTTMADALEHYEANDPTDRA